MMKTGQRFIPGKKREIEVLFSNRAIAEAEKSIGRGILEVLNDFGSGKSGISDVAQLLAAGMEAARRYHRAGGKRVSLDEAFSILDECGFLTVATPVFEALAEVISYSPEADSDADPEETAKKN